MKRYCLKFETILGNTYELYIYHHSEKEICDKLFTKYLVTDFTLDDISNMDVDGVMLRDITFYTLENVFN